MPILHIRYNTQDSLQRLFAIRGKRAAIVQGNRKQGIQRSRASENCRGLDKRGRENRQKRF